MLSVFPRIQVDCKENGLEQRQIQNGEQMLGFPLASITLWAQEEVSDFQQKQFEHLLQSLLELRARKETAALGEGKFGDIEGLR
jgi:hypothetical protein